MPFQSLHFDILICIAEHLGARDLLAFSQTHRALRPFGKLDALWKPLCRTDHGLTYNHPDQSYHTLYSHSSARTFGRPPCRHLSTIPASWSPPNARNLNALCCRDTTVSCEKLFICMTCARPLCDRHARNHSDHVVFYKPNMAEVFCQHCVDWLGGRDSDPAEQYQVALISTRRTQEMLCGDDDADALGKAMALRARRQHERWLRWQDTPSRIVMNPRGYCFVSARFMWEWERFVEGWRTDPPLEETINHEHRPMINESRSDQAPLVRFDPFMPEATDLLMVSTETWEYLEQAYIVAGPKISEDDLLHSEIYHQWKYTMMRYRDRVMLRY